MSGSNATGVDAETAGLVKDVAVPLIEKLGVDPCVLGIVTVVVACLIFTAVHAKQMTKHQETIMRQWFRATGGKDCGND